MSKAHRELVEQIRFQQQLIAANEYALRTTDTRLAELDAEIDKLEEKKQFLAKARDAAPESIERARVELARLQRLEAQREHVGGGWGSTKKDDKMERLLALQEKFLRLRDEMGDEAFAKFLEAQTS